MTKEDKKNRPTVIILVQGGVVDVELLPAGVNVIIQDYDLEGNDCSEEDLDRGYIRRVFEGN